MTPMPSEPSPQRGISVRRLVPLGLLVAAGIAFVAVGGSRYLTWAALAENHDWLCSLVERWGFVAAVLYIAVYGILVALSVPGGAVLTIAGGFLFGVWLGALCAIVGATPGATAIFLIARASLGALARARRAVVGKLEAGFRADASSYLLVLRLVPIFPFWLVNLVPALVGVELRPMCSAALSASSRAPSSMPASAAGSAASSPDDTRPPMIVFRAERAVPILGLAALALVPVVYRRWRGKRHRMSRTHRSRSLRHRRRLGRAGGRRRRRADGRARSCWSSAAGWAAIASIPAACRRSRCSPRPGSRILAARRRARHRLCPAADRFRRRRRQRRSG